MASDFAGCDDVWHCVGQSVELQQQAVAQIHGSGACRIEGAYGVKSLGVVQFPMVRDVRRVAMAASAESCGSVRVKGSRWGLCCRSLNSARCGLFREGRVRRVADTGVRAVWPHGLRRRLWVRMCHRRPSGWTLHSDRPGPVGVVATFQCRIFVEFRLISSSISVSVCSSDTS